MALGKGEELYINVSVCKNRDIPFIKFETLIKLSLLWRVLHLHSLSEWLCHYCATIPMNMIYHPIINKIIIIKTKVLHLKT